MSKWISGQQIVQSFGITKIELYDLVKKGLQPYNELARPIQPPNVQEIERNLGMYRFRYELLEKNWQQALLRGTDESELEEQKQELKKKIEELESKLSEIEDETEDHPWKAYCLPASESEAKEVLNNLRRALYKYEDVVEVVKELPEKDRDRLLAQLKEKAANLAPSEAEKAKSANQKEAETEQQEKTQLGSTQPIIIPPAQEEKPLRGWKAIAEFSGWSESKAKRLREELQESEVIFYEFTGRPPRKSVKAYPSDLKEFVKRKPKGH